MNEDDRIIEDLKKKIIERAYKQYRKVVPVSRKKNFSECFVQYENMLYFWFNTDGDTTRIIKERIPTKQS